jgi:uncharacterized membrane protein YphA (DoxX/SURF4 family)
MVETASVEFSITGPEQAHWDVRSRRTRRVGFCSTADPKSRRRGTRPLRYADVERVGRVRSAVPAVDHAEVATPIVYAEVVGGAGRNVLSFPRYSRRVASVSPRLLDAIGTLVRLGLAVVWLVAGGIKAADLNQNYLAVKAYRVLPDAWVSPVSAAQPFVELALGALLLFGIGIRAVSVLSAVLLLLFIAGVAQSWARGLTIDCGCFGGGGQVAAGQTQYPQEIARDVGFLVLAGWLVVRPRTLLSVDGWLRGGEHAVLSEPGDEADGSEDEPASPAPAQEGR